MRKAIFSCVVLMLALFSRQAVQAQNHDGFTKAFSLSSDTAVIDLQADGDNHLYVLLRNGQIHEYDEEGQLIHSNDFSDHGRPSMLDISNPLKPSLFFADSRNILILDQQLNLVTELDFARSGIQNVSNAIYSPIDQIWYFDSGSQKLIACDGSFGHISETEDLINLCGKKQNIRRILYSSNGLMLCTEANEILFFDRNGTFIKKESLMQKSVQQLGLKNEEIYFVSNGLVYIHSQEGPEYRLIVPEVNNIQRIVFGRDMLWIQNDKGIVAFHIG